MIKIDNLGEVLEGIDRWVEACEELADDTFRGMTALAFRHVVMGTPEWSGNLAASWRLTVGSPSTGYSETVFKGVDVGGIAINPEPFSKIRPNYAAINYALALAKEQLPFVRVGADAFISNNAPYVLEVDANRRGDGKSFLRVVNLPVEMTHAAVDKLNAMGSLSEAAALKLAQEKL